MNAKCDAPLSVSRSRDVAERVDDFRVLGARELAERDDARLAQVVLRLLRLRGLQQRRHQRHRIVAEARQCDRDLSTHAIVGTRILQDLVEYRDAGRAVGFEQAEREDRRRTQIDVAFVERDALQSVDRSRVADQAESDRRGGALGLLDVAGHLHRLAALRVVVEHAAQDRKRLLRPEHAESDEGRAPHRGVIVAERLHHVGENEGLLRGRGDSGQRENRGVDHVGIRIGELLAQERHDDVLHLDEGGSNAAVVLRLYTRHAPAGPEPRTQVEERVLVDLPPRVPLGVVRTRGFTRAATHRDGADATARCRGTWATAGLGGRTHSRRKRGGGTAELTPVTERRRGQHCQRGSHEGHAEKHSHGRPPPRSAARIGTARSIQGAQLQQRPVQASPRRHRCMHRFSSASDEST
jgi:hypothetical protein